MKKSLSIFVIISIILAMISTYVGIAYEGTQDDYYRQLIDKYNLLYDYSDPQFITDEQFFGEWDAASGEWIKESLFDYDSYPELRQVEEAAKEGDYSLCKEEILKYYKNVFKNFHYSSSSSFNTAENRLSAELAMENLYINGTGEPIARITLNGERQWYSADAQYSVNYMISGNYDKISFMIMDVNKDDFQASFNSKESTETDSEGKSTAPYMEVVVNGTKRRYDVTDDTYVKGGENVDTNYGAEECLYAEESVSSISKNISGAEKSPIDKFSKRVYLRFDLSDIDSTDVVSDARLNLYGNMTDSECDMKDGEVKSSMDVVVFNDPTVGVGELELDWTNTSMDYAFSYDGESGPLYFCQPTKNSNRWTSSVAQAQLTTLAQLYDRTKNEAYCYTFMRYMVNCAKYLGTEMEAQTNMPLYQTGSRLGYIARNMIWIMSSDSINPEWFTIVLKYIHMQLDWLVDCWNSEGEGNNIGTIITKGMLETANEFVEFKRYSEPLGEIRDPNLPLSYTGGWQAVGLKRMMHKLSDAVNPDGSGHDVPVGYLNTAFGTWYAPYYFIESSLGKEVGLSLDDDTKQLIENIAEFAVDMSNPLGEVWQHGDDGNFYGDPQKKISNILTYVKTILGETELTKWYKSDHTDGTAPDHTSAVYDIPSQAVLRQSWDKYAVAAHFNSDAGYHSHGHMDDLTLNVAAYGKYLLVDGNIGSYTTDKGAYNWQRSTRGHNTIEINDASQTCQNQGAMNMENYYDDPLHSSFNKAEQKTNSLFPEDRELNDSYDYIVGETNGYKNNSALKENFEVKRSVLFIKDGYFIVSDYIKPDSDETENKYSMAWHYYPGSGAVLDEDTKITTTNFNGEPNVMVVPVDDDNELSAKIREGLYSNNASASPQKNLYTELVKKVKGTATFNTIIYPTMPVSKANIRTCENILDVEKSAATSFSSTIEDLSTNTKKNISYYKLFDEAQKAERTFGTYTTNGTLAFVQKTGEEYSKLIIRGGNSLKDASGNILISYSGDADLKDLGVDYDGTEISLQSSDLSLEEMKKLVLYAPANIKTATFNGTQVSFKKSGNKVYMDASAVVPIPPEPEAPGNKPQGDNVHSSSGAMGGNIIGGGIKPKDESNISFTDIKNHWAYECIKDLADKGYISGYGDNTFKPDSFITRAEFIKIAVSVTGEPLNGATCEFEDVQEDDWYAGYIAAALMRGIISKDVYFRPNDYITREEMCKILYLTFFCNEGENGESRSIYEFKDFDDISPWALPYVARLCEKGVVTGSDTGEILPKGSATRAETAAVISRILKTKF